MKTNLSWTKPYCGVSHLNFGDSFKPRVFQVTIEEYPSFAEGWILRLEGFKRLFEIRGDLEFVKKELVKQAKKMQIV
jgi:hypothetical protein